MMTYKKKVPAETMLSIEQAFYRYDASKMILDNAPADAELNAVVKNIIYSTYMENYAVWKKKMDNAEYDLLGNLYRAFPYTYTMDFVTNTAIFSIENDANDIDLQQLGFIPV